MILLTDDFDDGMVMAGGGGGGDRASTNQDMEAAYRALAHLGAAAGVTKHLGIASRAGPDGEFLRVEVSTIL